MRENQLKLPSSASTQFNSISPSIEAELVIFSFDPAPSHPPTQPPTHQEKFQLKLERSQIKKDWFNTTLGLPQANLYKNSKPIKEYLNFKNTSMPQNVILSTRIYLLKQCYLMTPSSWNFDHVVTTSMRLHNYFKTSSGLL